MGGGSTVRPTLGIRTTRSPSKAVGIRDSEAMGGRDRLFDAGFVERQTDRVGTGPSDFIPPQPPPSCAMSSNSTIPTSHQPTAIAPAIVQIAHLQLRDLIICPRERGTINYVQANAIVEQNINMPGAPTRILSLLHFTPISLAHLSVGGNKTLIAAGGQDSEIHLSLHTPSSSQSNRTRYVWELQDRLNGSINNSVLLTSLNLTRANESSIEPIVGISNNDGTVRLYNIPMRVHHSWRKLLNVGQISLDVPINHTSISPDGRTLLSVGDSNRVYLHRITGGAQVTFSPITNLTIPPPDLSHPDNPLIASFSTAFSSDGSKFAVASQEGVVAVWDIRSTSKPIKVFQTDKTTRRCLGGNATGLLGNGAATGWLSDDPWEVTKGDKFPGWCVRNVKFNGGARQGKEIMAFTEHTSFVHIVDARTFEVDETIRVPTIHRTTASGLSATSTSLASGAQTSSLVQPIQVNSDADDMNMGSNYPEHDSVVEEEEGQQTEDKIDVDMDTGESAGEDCEESEDGEDRKSMSSTFGYGSLYGYYEDLDLAGLCFDPSGERMYVAGNGVTSSADGMDMSAGAVVEWGVCSE